MRAGGEDLSLFAGGGGFPGAFEGDVDGDGLVGVLVVPGFADRFEIDQGGWRCEGEIVIGDFFRRPGGGGG